MTRYARLKALSARAARSTRSSTSTFALSALMLALTGCASVPDSNDDAKPPPMVATVGAREQPLAARSEGPLSPVPGIEQVITVKAPLSSGEDLREAIGAPVDPLSPDQSMVLNDPNARQDLWGRVRAGFGMPTLDNELVRDHEHWYTSRPDYVKRMTERGSRYLFHVVEELERRKMPTELALLPFIESAFNPQAMSSARASGMWQFMPLTGKDYDLKQNMFRDDRRDVLASTRAALDYLGRLNKMFNGDWQLSLAAYNWGEGNVKRAIARNERAGLPTDYESLNMPAETRHYVPKFQAVKNIVTAPQDFGLELLPLENHPYFVSVPIRRDMDVSVAARLAGMSMEEFKALNPQMNKPVILAAGTPQVLLPYDNADGFIRRLAEYREPLASWTAWTAPRTIRPAEAARLTGMSEATLREMNRIPRKMLIKAGSTLLIQRSSEHRVQDVPEHVANNAYMALAPDVPPLRKVAIKARKGDTVLALAKRYRVSASQLAQWNRIDDGTRFKKAQSLVIWQPIKEAGASRREMASLNKADRKLSRKVGGKSAKASTRMASKTARRQMASMAAVKGTKIRPIRLARK
ncbi:transglycosylase SLT domain-containing protein [Sphaerotilus montanus]|uniref:Membrane-bound lytic murein transglycosylase D n=1 Tax=Sphaerotilus montanus TaxID=522889 RepID=A0A7Y9R0Z9_9BURK|nr:transglycosylase SLT domain-containing protein [Sphaerotilus montanus]NYG34306.1 membrane-bound lytic murein transglycosylase D [Sphaerotilus montanus]